MSMSLLPITQFPCDKCRVVLHADHVEVQWTNPVSNGNTLFIARSRVSSVLRTKGKNVFLFVDGHASPVELGKCELADALCRGLGFRPSAAGSSPSAT